MKDWKCMVETEHIYLGIFGGCFSEKSENVVEAKATTHLLLLIDQELLLILLLN